MPLKLIEPEINLESPTTVNDASNVRLFNNSSNVVLVTQKNSEGDVIGSISLGASERLTIRKDFTDTFEGGASVLAVKIAFHY
jgi:hypothetical protein